MKKTNISIEEFNTRCPNSNEEYFSNLNREQQEKYMFLYNIYSSALTEFFIRNFRLKEYDSILANSNCSFPIVSEENMDIYQYQASGSLNYFYVRNNIFIERLTKEEQRFLIEKFKDGTTEYDEEIDKFISSTFKKIILDDPNEQNHMKSLFGPDNSKFMKPNNAIIIGLRYDDYQRLPGESAEAWDEENNKRLGKCELLMNMLKFKMSKDTGIPVEVIKYNEFSIKKKGYSEEGEKVK